MSTLPATPSEPLRLLGDARARGMAQAAGSPGLAEQVREATLGRVDAARAEGWMSAPMLDYVADHLAFARAHCRPELDELTGIAEGFGLSFDDLFLHLHLGTLRDLSGGATLDADGCSAWASGQGPDGPIAAKNRDFTGVHKGIQRMFRHEGPDLKHGPMLYIGSLGAPGAYSSGLNAAGLAVLDTQVGVRRHRVGWLRYFLMTRLLSQAGSVAEAVKMVEAMPHAGGGTLVLADATGDAAAVELGAKRVTVERGPLVFRTNHYVTAPLAGETLHAKGDCIDANSSARRDHLAATLPGRAWSAADAAALMATHDEPGRPSAPICQHAGRNDAQTISSAVFCCRLGRVYFHEGNPCSGRWTVYNLSG